MITVYVALFLLSAAMMSFELILVRLFAVTQWHHFAFISVSVALLGLGASGSWLSLYLRRWQERDHKAKRDIMASAAWWFSTSIVLSYLIFNRLPFDSYRLALERRQLLYLGLYYGSLLAPFLFAGFCTALCLATWPERVNSMYAANMGGAAVGSLATLALVACFGGTGAILGASLLAMLAGFMLEIAAHEHRREGWTSHRLLYIVSICLLLVLLGLEPTGLALRISPYKAEASVLRFPGARAIFSRWSASALVDVVESEGIHSAPGLSLSYTGGLPQQLALFVDGEGPSAISCLREPADELFLAALPIAVPLQLRPGASVLAVEPRGGLDVLAALYNGASIIQVVESNPLVAQAVSSQADLCPPSFYQDERVQVVLEEVRSFLRRSTEKFDVLLLSPTTAFQPVTSGAYALSEAYAYTVEAVHQYLSHLRPDGLLVITRWMQAEPSEEVRAGALLVAALRARGAVEPSEHVFVFRSWSTITLVGKPTPFTAREIEQLKTLCDSRGYDTVFYRGIPASESNRYNILPNMGLFDVFQELLRKDGLAALVQRYPYDISPSTDDRPFFFHYFKWTQVPTIVRNLGKGWLPFGGSGFLILPLLLVVTTILSVALIILPLAYRAPAASAGASPAVRTWVPFYFISIGWGFLFVEMPLMQQFILFLGQPSYSFSLVLFALLLFSGLGSLCSRRVSCRPALLCLAGMVLLYPFGLSRLFSLFLQESLLVRLALSIVGLAPLGFMLGLPMPLGISLLEHGEAEQIPWAWAVNGCASVTGSILATMGAISLGFSRMLIAGAIAYAVAWLSIRNALSTGGHAIDRGR